MKKILLPFFLFCFSLLACVAQKQEQVGVDSLRAELSKAKTDSTKISLLLNISGKFVRQNSDSAIHYAREAFLFSKRIKFQKGVLISGTQLSRLFQSMLNFDSGFHYCQTTLDIAKQLNNSKNIGELYASMAYIVLSRNATSGRENENNVNTDAILYYDSALTKYFSINDTGKCIDVLARKAEILMYVKKYSEAKSTFNAAFSLSKFSAFEEQLSLYNIYADFLSVTGNLDSSLFYYKKSLLLEEKRNNYIGIAYISGMMAVVLARTGNYNDAIKLGEKGLKICIEKNYLKEKLDCITALYRVHKLKGDFKTALTYYEELFNITDSINNQQSLEHISKLNLQIEAQKNQEKIILLENDKVHQRNLLYGLLGLVFIVLIFATIFFRQRNKITKEKNRSEVLNANLTNALGNLKEAQSRLIQQEKLASLGELTAGIAHEIQNPLNFVNNFSSISESIVDEFIKAKTDDEKNELAADLKNNLSKIKEHGLRIERIVRAMNLQASQGKNEKTPVVVNRLLGTLTDILYSTFQNSHPHYECRITKNFDTKINEIELVQQTFTQAIGNIILNSFYYSNLKNKDTGNIAELLISTQLENKKLIIKIRDNGAGIKYENLSKIFEPFYTTKPTGDGKGLGLASSYEIIKSHGGEIKVESKEAEFTEFIVELPAK